MIIRTPGNNFVNFHYFHIQEKMPKLKNKLAQYLHHHLKR